MTYPIFPTSPKPSYPYHWESGFLTIVGGPYDGGGSVTRSGRPYELFTVALKWDRRTRAELLPIVDFFRARRGRSGLFVFADFQGWDNSPIGEAWNDVYVATYQSGGSTTVTLPVTSGSSHVVKVNGVTDAGATISAGTGDEGQDEATIAATLVQGDIITSSFVGLLTLLVRATQDTLAVESEPGNLHSLTLGLIEERIT